MGLRWIKPPGSNNFRLPSSGDCDPRVELLLYVIGLTEYHPIFAKNWKGDDPCVVWIGISYRLDRIIVIDFADTRKFE